MAHGYTFKAYASKANPDYIPSLIGVPTSGASDVGYFEQHDIADTEVFDAITATKWVVEGSTDPIMQVRTNSRKLIYIPETELIEQFADDAIVKAAIRSGFVRIGRQK